MDNSAVNVRRTKHSQLSSHLAQMSNAQLRSLIPSVDELALGFGLTSTIDLDASKVFVKRVPVTDLEYEHVFSTHNIYRLPAYFNYGIGSIGLGVFRELMTCLKTTHWVLTEAIATFPLMYHYQIVPLCGQQAAVDPAWLETFVEKWGGNENIRRYAIDKLTAHHELLIFLEYVPHVLATWLPDNIYHLQTVLDELWTTLAFLKKKGVIHFDAHFHNILTDGNQIYLADFGLALDKGFSLTKEEVSFWDKNSFYDYGEILRNLDHLLRAFYKASSAQDKREMLKKYGIKEDSEGYEMGTMLLNNIEQIRTDGPMGLDESYVDCVVRDRGIIMLIRDFYFKIWNNKKKDTAFPNAELQQLLQEAGIL